MKTNFARIGMRDDGEPALLLDFLQLLHEHQTSPTGWMRDCPMPADRFDFAPTEGAIEQPAGANAVKLAYDSATGKTKVSFYHSPSQ